MKKLDKSGIRRRTYGIRSPRVRFKNGRTPYVRVNDGIWKLLHSEAGVHHARMRVLDWEIHLMRVLMKVTKGWEYYYIGMAVNQTDKWVVRKTATKVPGIYEARVLNEMFAEHIGIIFKI